MDPTSIALPAGGMPVSTAAEVTRPPVRCGKSWHPDCTSRGGAVLKHAESLRVGVCCCCRNGHGVLGAGHVDGG